MNNLKFRAWDGERMLQNVGVHPFISEVHDHYDRSDEGYMTISPKMESYKIMQFTGVLDINDKEVYAGDIIRIYCCADKDSFHVAVVEWNAPYFQTSDKEVSRLNVHPIEVIGNIYEHPELMEAA